MEAEGRIPFHGYETWWRSVGPEDGDAIPLLCLHGGPGANWLHLKPYEALADERRVVFYDQLGAGNSAVEGPHDASMWTPELYVEEVGVVREALGLDRVHVLGHSWGGMLAMQYGATQPDGLVSLVVESSPPSVPAWMGELAKLRAELPPEVDATLRKHEEAGTFTDPEYEEAVMVFYKRHLCRADPWPDWVVECFEVLEANPEVYHAMNGPSRVPRDRDDQGLGHHAASWAGSRCRRCSSAAATTRSRRRASRSRTGRFRARSSSCMEESSHMAQAEQPEETLELVRGFLARVEG